MPAAPSAQPRRDLSAILFADVHGYAKLMDRNEERTYERVTRSIRLIKSLIGDYGGRVMNVAGDGVLALFESAPQALKFAVTIQQEFRNETVWSPDDEAVAFRIGINIGEVLVDEEANVQGRSVNVAARIQGLARPGGICVSEAVRRAVSDTLGVSMRSLGPQVLKNIAEPMEIFAIEINGPQIPEPASLLPRPSPWAQSPPIGPQHQASVAVLPLDNLSGDPRDQHLCDGITGDIITNLSRFRDLLVIARRSVFLFKGQSLPPDQIASQLGVRYLLTGGVQRNGTKLRLRVELAEAKSGRVIWSDRYSGILRNLFEFQDDVTAVIAARLAVQIDAAEQRRLLSEAPPDLRAYGLILRGQQLSLLVAREANLYARRLFEEAAHRDPDYARSYAGLARTFQEAWRYHWSDTPDLCLTRAVELAQHAIQLDPSDARGYAALGEASLFKRKHDESLAAYDRAIGLNPNDADVLADSGHCIACSGDPQRGIERLQQAMRLNPYYPDWYVWILGEIHFDLGNYQEAVRTLSQMHDKSDAYRLLAASHALLGDMTQARHYGEQVLILQPEFTLAHWRNVPPDRNPDARDRYLEGLRKAGLK
jgi:TolB-like protein/class 3 adenylate cyclase/Tfp pilus assembly protein PilF